jgi:hypothetical protein
VKPRQPLTYDSAWALWQFNDHVAVQGLDAGQTRVARQFFLLGVQAALSQITERVGVANADAQRVLNR